MALKIVTGPSASVFELMDEKETLGHLLPTNLG